MAHTRVIDSDDDLDSDISDTAKDNNNNTEDNDQVQLPDEDNVMDELGEQGEVDEEDEQDNVVQSSREEEENEEGSFRTPSPKPASEKPSRLGSVVSYRFRESPQRSSKATSQSNGENEDTIVVMVPPPDRAWEYESFRGDTTVESVLKEVTGPDGEVLYRIEYGDGTEETITYDKLSSLRNGMNALDFYNNRDSDAEDMIVVESKSSSEPASGMSSRNGKRTRRQPHNNGFVTSFDISSEEESPGKTAPKKRRLLQSTISAASFTNARRSARVSSRPPSRPIVNDDDDEEQDSESEDAENPRRVTRFSRNKQTRSSTSKLADDEDELAGDIQTDSEGSDVVYAAPRAKTKPKASARKSGPGRPRRAVTPESSPERPTRVSGRGNKARKNMREVDMDEELYADDVGEMAAPKIISIRENYKPLPKQSHFRLVHDQNCDVCGGIGRNSSKGTSELVYCQGCSSSIHRICLGYRSNREHMVTKIGHEDFVMQCRRCIGLAVKKDPLAPRLGACTICKQPGPSCAAFSPKKTTKQEEKLREENGGDDPITEVGENLINNPDNVLFRCRGCQRAFHFEHLPPLDDSSSTPDDLEELRNERYHEYTKDWQCKECSDVSTKLQTLVAWRPSDPGSYGEVPVHDKVGEDDKEYLVKWAEKSYFQCSWEPGAWVWGVAAASMRKAFTRRGEGVNMLPKMTEEEAIPEEFLRMEIVFDVEYDDSFQPKSEAHDKAHIDDVDRVFVKFRGLPYDESVWEEPPSPEDTDRWSEFVAAYNEYVMGKYFKQVPTKTLQERIDGFRSMDFQKKLILKKQPSGLVGGEMMSYQLEGLNWLLYNFHQEKNVILADEMGLGKTIQIISLISSLVKDKPKCWPFLVVTPNSTCPNWRREIKKWAPDLRVVAYYGAKSARDMAMKYELYPDGCSDLRAHVVVTSYEAPVDDHSKHFFKSIKWAGMIVDEGQRLKNDENQLYVALTALKAPFQVLLTGTPLQNNKRELFNLLQFLDESLNAAQLDAKYAELTKDNLPELHELIRPFFLRRTKLQVLKFLPPMAQVILPVTMSVLQKKLYKSILAKNPELIKSIFGQSKKTLRPTERGNLNNILMQLRKCLCHPFVYSSAIEETSVGESQAHRNLIDASSKFQLLEIMLPKLRERGHRVLIFSQFLNQLDIVEDFLNGLELPFGRLDGSINALEKQKRIDEFNAPDSRLFAFLLSTRAGGVGINLATADTVIIMPHQDIQALSRAHRIGQKKKVLVFQLMTKDSAEEKIVQIGRKKMALDQALIESMDAEDDAGVDVESILKHGAEALFNDDDKNDIHYDAASVDKLLDRTQVENTDTNDEKTAESQFSHARVWAQDRGVLSDDVGDADDEPSAPNASVWDAILKQREADAAHEAARNRQVFGRGKRARQAVDYEKSQMELDEMIDSPPKHSRRKKDSMSDTEFAAEGGSDAEDSDGFGVGDINPHEFETNMKGTKIKRRVRARQPAKVSVQPTKIHKMRDFRLTLTFPSPCKSARQRGSGKRTDDSANKAPQSSKKTNLSVKPIHGKELAMKSPQKPNNTAKSKPATVIKAHARSARLQTPSTVVEQGLITVAGEGSSNAAPAFRKSKVIVLRVAKTTVNDDQASAEQGDNNAEEFHPLQPHPRKQSHSQPSQQQEDLIQAGLEQQVKVLKKRGRPSGDRNKPKVQGSSTSILPSSPVPLPQRQHLAAENPHPQIENPLLKFAAQPSSSARQRDSHPSAYPAKANQQPRTYGQCHNCLEFHDNRPCQATVRPQNHFQCPQCRGVHVPGPCKADSVEYCNLCGIAHYGGPIPSCPHLQSKVQIRLMLDALRSSNERSDLVAEAIKALREELRNRAKKKQSLPNGNGNASNGYDHRYAH